jgi:Uma2 family endonuclease
MSTATLPPAVPPLVTADEFLKRHGDESGVELIDGVITRLPMPGLQHGEVCGHAYDILREQVKPHKLGRLFINDSFVRTTATGVRGADVKLISYATLPATVPTPVGAITPPLELVVEVRSPSDTIPELTDKANEYLRAGVMAVLVLDPQTDTAAVHRLNELPLRFSNGDLVTLPEVSPAFAVPASRFFE